MCDTPWKKDKTDFGMDSESREFYGFELPAGECMEYKVFPEGYDPHVALGPPDKDFIRAGVTWMPEETEKMKELGKQFVIVSYRPTKRWFVEIEVSDE